MEWVGLGWVGLVYPSCSFECYSIGNDTVEYSADEKDYASYF